ncbi:SpoIIE family protein phosphatase [Streptomyces sp. H34-S4]|uniref:SpoIIE family protein phosphatase n=1 Tax=Streptomyces sp. H34-S4 TaxID=2996463 RepID=UPI00226F6240|nr:SpoIIE family protein phosphatase [Streptomyces sp. H34-S4]MCY0939327.1 SpoIIE family protein phosphatase [Streptomyces sp. H34-S4]
MNLRSAGPAPAARIGGASADGSPADGVCAAPDSLLVDLSDGPDGDGPILHADPRAAALLGMDPHEMVGLPFSALAPSGYAGSLSRLLLDAVPAGPAGSEDPAVVRRPLLLRGTGEAVLCLVSARPVVGLAGRAGPDGRPVAVVELEPAMPGESESWAVLHAMSVLRGQSIWAYDEEHDRFRWVENSLEYSRHRNAGDLPLRKVLDQLHPDDVAHVKDAFWALRRGEREVVNIRFRYPDGRGGFRWLRSVSRIMRIGFEGTRRIVGSTSDHTAAVEHDLAVTREHTRQSGLVRELAAAFVAAKTEEELTEAILHKVAPAFAGTGTLLAFVENERLRVTFGEGIDPAMARSLHGMGLDAPKPLAHAVRTGRTEAICSREAYRAAWPQAHGLLDATTAQSFLMVPFAAEPGAPLGGWVITYDAPHRITEPERTLLEVIAELAGQAWARIRLSTARLELAGALQRDLLPAVLPRVEGFEIAARYLPANEGLEVGGDWYDVIALPDGGVACIIGDVQGHNIQAAALMGQVRTAMHAYAWEDPSPDRVLERTNELMMQMGATGFATCLYALLHPSGRMLSARAGHVPPVLCGTSEATAPETPGGLPLGVQNGTRYPLSPGRLAEGETLALFTDGLVEGPRLSLDEGTAQVCRTLEGSREAPAEQLADALMSCAQATDHSDDRAVLVVRRLRQAGRRRPRS